ncbi:PQQ-binding-like beta-propeller repeat protein [Nocardiopsis halotolerans]|uniref:PQQ-binding-like beta-propeller repeat protein n=1 Tax=Nocardiopsis halotolerans TaxID=124252 RepID=UPI00034C2590|nr:PQQ-binding-like beta-propeller repeat protein [Nocardiopsis halotolerans]
MRRRNSILALAVLPLLASCSVFPGWGDPEVDHVTLSEPAESLDVPANVGSVGWTWSSPEETGIQHVSPISYGLVVSISDGVVGVSGGTGEELWRYRRLGERLTGASVTPDGETVAVSYSAHDGEAEGEEEPHPLHEVVLLDSSTGDIKGTQTVEFANMPFADSGVSSYASGDEQLGVLSNSSRIIYRGDGRGEGEIVSLGLEDDEELWSVTPAQSGGSERMFFVARSSVVSRGVLVTSSNFVDESVLEPGGLSGTKNHTLALIGIDVETGSELWRHEIEANEGIDLTPFKLGVAHGSGMVAAVASGYGYREEFLLDPTTGEVLTDAEFFTGEDDAVVGILEEAIVSARGVSDGDEYEYSYSDLSGEVQHAVTVPAPLGRGKDIFILAMEGSVAWLDVNEQAADGLSWGPAQLVVTDWDDGESRVIDLGIEVQRSPNEDESLGGSSALTPTPKSMALVPGALVVTEGLDGEDNEPSRRLVGLVP